MVVVMEMEDFSLDYRNGLLDLIEFGIGKYHFLQFLLITQHLAGRIGRVKIY